MKRVQFPGQSVFGVLALLAFTFPAIAFEGRINIVLSHGAQTNALLYTFGPEHLRVETVDSARPNPIDIVEQHSGAVTLVFPHNRSFVRLKPAAEDLSTGMTGMPSIPMQPGSLSPRIGAQTGASAVAPTMAQRPGMPAGLPPGIGPQASSSLPGASGDPSTMSAKPAVPQTPGELPSGVGPQPEGARIGHRGMPAMPRMPMPSMMTAKLELKASGKTTNILGYVCQQYELKQRGQTMEVWATDQLPPYQAYVRSQPHRFGPRMIEDQWPAMVAARKLFPLVASLRYDSGAERFRFEVTSVSEDKVAEPSPELFEAPTDYHEIQPLPF